jgi:hypothetical protein
MVGNVCHIKRFHLSGKRFVEDEEVETDNSQKTSMLQFLTPC